MKTYSLRVNRKPQAVEVREGTPLLWVLRDSLGLCGTKYGCGRGLCGCCTVHIDEEAVRSCVTPIDTVAGREVTTIEGLGGGGLHPLQQAWIDEQVPQCGYCQSGQIMTAAEFLRRNPNPSDDEITAAMWGNLCRCGTYGRIRRAIHRAAAALKRST